MNGAHRTLYLVNPASDFPTYFSAEVFAGRGLRPVTMMADLALPTLAAMAEPHLRVVLCDQVVEPVDFNANVDYVGITGKISQRQNMIAIARRFRAEGVKVIIGGPYASLDPEALRPHCDILVRGEIEPIADQLFSDLAAGTPREEYIGSTADLATVPMPAWHLYPNDRALLGTIQTSRGCPFECEFCDVIQYLGRRQRHKPVANVLAELEVLYSHGYRRILIADDNFTAYRNKAKELLDAFRHFNEQHSADPVRFVTQVSIDAARDEELLRMCAEGGLTHVFIGIETPSAESLREAHKRQNLNRNLVDDVHRFYANGVSVTAGLICGFDADDISIFERQYDFVMQTGIPVSTVGALVAPTATPLHARMAAAGRLICDDAAEVAAVPWMTNIIPAQMSRADLLAGIRWLVNRLYEPDAFGERLMRHFEMMPAPAERSVRKRTRRESRPAGDTLTVLRMLPQLGAAEAEMWSRVRRRLASRPDATEHIMRAAMHYVQARFMFENGFWDPQLGRMAAPPLESVAV